MNKLTARLGKEAIGLPTMPDELAEYMMRFHSAVEASISTTDVENGYGIRVERRIVLKRPYCRCNRCGYHSLWNPDDSESKCLRHTYEKGWDTVFCYDPDRSHMELKDAFVDWLTKQPKRENEKTVFGLYAGGEYGRITN